MAGRIYKLSNNESERIDTIKVIMRIYVLYIHSYSSAYKGLENAVVISNVSHFISNIFCDCAVPAFVLISSTLLYSKEFSWKKNVYKKIKSLLIPYLIFNTLWIIVMIGKSYISGTMPEYFSYGILDWLDAFFGIKGEFKPALSVLWYVRDLFLLNLLAGVIKKLVDRYQKIIVILTLILWLSCVKSFIIHNYALVYWILGYYVVKYDIHCTKNDKLDIIIATAIYLVCAVISFVSSNVELIHRLFIIVSIFYVVKISEKLIPMNKFFRLILPASFFIYLTHRFVYLGIQLFYNDTLFAYTVMYFVKPILTLLICLAAFYMMKRICPRLLGLLTGGRLETNKRKV
ncbi:MAG: acyltransferase [Clostridia bacterium]|nr:acyltransferase [Clostridia bacterium]